MPRPPGAVKTKPDRGGRELEISKEHLVQYAHYGYVFCMILAKGLGGEAEEETLISGGGDGTIKLWRLDPKLGGGISEIACLEGGDLSVLSMALDGTFLYSGLLEGGINVWDLDTRQLVRVVKAHSNDCLTLCVGGGIIFSGGGGGHARKSNQKYQQISKWKAHDGLILASAVTLHQGRRLYVTGGNDNCVAIWDVSDCFPEQRKAGHTSDEKLLESLARFVGYKTVSSDETLAEDCRRGATYLKRLFTRFGATTQMLNTEGHLNPVVFAKFNGNPEVKDRKKILFYGHYDVIAAMDDMKKWIVDPFVMQGINGYLYGRGVSDNKGPLLAAIFAVAELVNEKSLDSDIIFLIEGEEERGSRGFQDAVRKNKHIIGDVDWILLANSYWLDDEVPCLTYGLRGVIHATVSIESDHPDLHSGVDGSEILDEALKDLIKVTSALSGTHGHIKIPGFYDPILPVTEAEKRRYEAITSTLLRRNPDLGNEEDLTQSLMHRWREPSLTVHRLKVSGPENSTVIPRLAQACISLRLVPNQDLEVVRTALLSYLQDQFSLLESKNILKVSIDHQAEPWLGDPDNELFRTLEEAIMAVWGPIVESRRTSVSTNKENIVPIMTPLPATTSQKPKPTTSSTLTNGSDHMSSAMASSPTLMASRQNRPSFSGGDIPPSPLNPSALNSSSAELVKARKPLYIREGGSIPAIRFLEKEFNAPAAHLPCGQASDSAHLDNERLRLVNLYKSREIFKVVFRDLPRK
jgi:di- and tripeptidase